MILFLLGCALYCCKYKYKRLVNLITWSNRWQMTFNPEKFEVLELKRSLSTSYILNGQKLSVVAKHNHKTELEYM